MITTRRRRIVRRTVIALAIVAALVVAWRSTREPPEIRLSKGVRLGMTLREVESIVGPRRFSVAKSDGLSVLYGSSGIPWGMRILWAQVFGNLDGTYRAEEWPVIIRLNKGEVVYIKRGDEIEKAP